MNTTEKHLYYFNELKGYKINHHDHDIRGWVVKDLDNRVIGKVDNFLVNKELGKVVYVDVEVDHSIIDANHDPFAAHQNSEVREFINKEGENHLIIPIGLIDINPKDKYVYTDTIDYQTFAETKRYSSGSHISRDYERHVLGSYNRKHTDNHDSRIDEVKRTRGAYTDAKLTDREIKEREYRNKELTENERIEDERLREERRIADARQNENIRNDENVEERMRREKENLRHTSEERRRVEDHEYRDRSSGDLNPERTYDEDQNWQKEDPSLREEDPNLHRRRTNIEKDDSFYDRREFREREYKK